MHVREEVWLRAVEMICDGSVRAALAGQLNEDMPPDKVYARADDVLAAFDKRFPQGTTLDSVGLVVGEEE